MRCTSCYLRRLQHWLKACEVPVQLVLWNPGLSPPIEIFLDVEATPIDHHRANVLLQTFLLENHW